MTIKPILLFAITCLLIAAPLIGAQQEGEPKFKMVKFHMALLRKGPKWEGTAEQERNQILRQHFTNGPMGDDTDPAGIFILRAASADEAKGWVEADPAVKAGLFAAEMHLWFSQDIFKKANSPLKFSEVYLGFLKKGPNRKEGDGETPEVQELQKAHLANINRLAGLKKLIVAGPFGDDGNLRGIFVFRVSSLQEAQDLCATDPMIRIGRLVVELHPWKVPEGVLP
jgi:uncharacterized protein YciI